MNGNLISFVNENRFMLQIVQLTLSQCEIWIHSQARHGYRTGAHFWEYFIGSCLCDTIFLFKKNSTSFTIHLPGIVICDGESLRESMHSGVYTHQSKPPAMCWFTKHTQVQRLKHRCCGRVVWFCMAAFHCFCVFICFELKMPKKESETLLTEKES